MHGKSWIQGSRVNHPLPIFCENTTDRDYNFFPDPSSSIYDRSLIGQTGTTHSVLCLAV